MKKNYKECDKRTMYMDDIDIVEFNSINFLNTQDSKKKTTIKITEKNKHDNKYYTLQIIGMIHKSIKYKNIRDDKILHLSWFLNDGQSMIEQMNTVYEEVAELQNFFNDQLKFEK